MFPAATIFNYVFATVALTLGFLVVVRNPRNLQNKLFALFTLASAFWIFSSATVDVFASDLDTALIFADLAIVGGFFLLPTLLLFVHYFIRELYKLKPTHVILIYLPAIVALPFTFTPYNIESVSRESWGVNFVPGNLYSVLLLYWLAMIALSTFEFIKKYKKFSKEEVGSLRPVFIGSVLMVFVGVIANAVLPALGIGMAAIFGPIASVFFIIFTTYAIARHQLLNVKMIATELFLTVMVFLITIQLFTAKIVLSLIYWSLLSAAMVIFAILLIKSVRNEVKRREEIQDLAEKLKITNHRLRQLDDMKSTMVAIASHQIRGPLGGIRGYLTLFRDGDLGKLTEKQKEIIGLNVNVLSRLINAVETFLDITKIEAGKMNLNREKMPLRDVVDAVVQEFLIPMKKSLAFSVEFADEVMMVDIDPEKTKHVVFNLLDNAMKYTAAGSVSVRLRSEKGMAVCEITDTGMGVPPEDLARLFGKFERGELVVDRGGSGLGLYVVKMLTEMQGGRVWVSSPGKGMGTTFYVALPLVK